MNTKEIKKFESACETEKRADGVYIRIPGETDWAGPYKSGFDALRYFRLIFSVE